MKKIMPFTLSIMIFAIFYVLFTYRNHQILEENEQKLLYYNDDLRNNSETAMEIVLDDSNLAVFGSSELFAYDMPAHPKNLFQNGNSNYNMTLIGRDYFQSLLQAVTIGSLQDELPNQRAVLILSPQWFTQEQYNSDMFSSRFSERQFVQMLENKKISYETKRYLTDRALGYLKDGDPDEYKRVKKYEAIYLEADYNPASLLEMYMWDSVMNSKADVDLIKSLENVESTSSEEQIDIEEIDYQKLLSDAEKNGEEACTNNDIYVNDAYFSQWIEKDYYLSKDTNGSVSYTESPEYEDLQWLIRLCKECDIDLMLVSIPLNGAWSDWIGLPYENRVAYYQKIRNIAEGNEVELLDFSDKESEPYFLKDVMHMGWKAWVYFDEAAVRFSGNDSNDDFPFDMKAYCVNYGNGYKVVLEEHIADVESAYITIDGKDYVLYKTRNGFLESESLSEDVRTTTVHIQGKIGSGFDADVQCLNVDSSFLNYSESNGATKDGNTVVLTPDVTGAWFDRTLFQLYDDTGELVSVFGEANTEGLYVGEYRNLLSSGVYTLIFKANSNIKDEYIESKVYLNTGDLLYYQYNMNEILPTKIIISDFDVWNTSEIPEHEVKSEKDNEVIQAEKGK